MSTATELLWNPVSDITKTAYYNTVKNLPNWSVMTTNKKGKERLVTLVGTSAKYLELIIDGVHHHTTVTSLHQMASLLLGDLQADRLCLEYMDNEIFSTE